jgi:peptide/nickel transport system permease protein
MQRLSPILRFLALRLVRAAATLLICVTIVFVVLRSAGDPLASLLPDDTPPDVADIYRARFGLDRPILEQYLGYLASLAQGDFGRSFVEHRDALSVVLERVPATLELGGIALLAALAIGLPLGLVATVGRNTWVDRSAMVVAVFGYSLPNFFLAILLILLFAFQLRWLPSAGSDTAWHLVMPAIVLAAPPAAKIARFTRTSMIDVIGQPFMRTALAKGVPSTARLVGHALPNAAIPVVTFLGFEVGLMIGGGVVTEAIFAWPGIGRLLVQSVGQRDLAVVQTIVLMIAATMVAANLAVDLLYGWLDPRVRATGGRR